MQQDSKMIPRICFFWEMLELSFIHKGLVGLWNALCKSPYVSPEMVKVMIVAHFQFYDFKLMLLPPILPPPIYPLPPMPMFLPLPSSYLQWQPAELLPTGAGRFSLSHWHSHQCIKSCWSAFCDRCWLIYGSQHHKWSEHDKYKTVLHSPIRIDVR